MFIPFRLKVLTDFLYGHPVLGIEKAGGWSSAQATLSRATGWVTEGITSLQIKPTTSFTVVTSGNFSTAGFTPVLNKLSLDFFVSPVQPTPSSIGTFEVLISIPSKGIFNQWLGQTVLTGLPQNTFSPIQYTLPAATVTALNTAPSDVSLTINLAVNAGSAPTSWTTSASGTDPASATHRRKEGFAVFVQEGVEGRRGPPRDVLHVLRDMRNKAQSGRLQGLLGLAGAPATPPSALGQGQSTPSRPF